MRKSSPMIVCPTATNRRFETRSAITPPKGEMKTVAIPIPNATMPTAPFFPVKSKATIDWTMLDIMNARKATVVPIQSVR